ncbi:MAG TPA: TMEM175 family protein [Rhodanobacteraceae bacterium]|nr:TMEM175 family protein [Rhodanobacteraceae bacterium]
MILKDVAGRGLGMHKGRMEAFTDGVIAVIITIMVLELKLPRDASWQGLLADVPVFLSYVLSFAYVGIYWNNHHHMLQMVSHVNGKVLWANLFFLFWLSLFPFTTSWLNETHPMPAPVPTALYGIVLLLAALSWIPLLRTLIAANGGEESKLGEALKGDWKIIVSPIGYVLGIVLAFFAPILSCVIYGAIAALWFIPDRRLETRLQA